MAEPYVLYTYWRSSCSHRVRIGLGFKKVAWTSVFVNLLEGAQAAPGYREKNPTGYVPALRIDDKNTLIESVAILEYLDEVHPTPALLPKEPLDRARVRALVEMIGSGIQPLQNLNVLRRVGGDDRDAQVAFARHYNERGLAAVEAALARFEADGIRGPFAYGSSFGMADVLLVPQVAAARRFGVDVGSFERVSRAESAASALDFVKAAAPEAQPDAKPA